MYTTDTRIALTLGSAAVAIAAMLAVYNLYDSGVKAELYRECLKTNEEIVAKAIAKGQTVHTIYCYM